MATPTVAESAAGEDVFQLLYRGGELLAAGNVTEAKDYLEKALCLEPENERGKNLLGLTYFKLGLLDRAAQLYEGLVQANPADPTLRVNLGLVYLKTNALSRAIHEFATATDLSPDHHKAHNYLGLALAQAGQYEKARQHFLIAGSPAMAEKMAEALGTQAVTAADGAPAASPAKAGDGLETALAESASASTSPPDTLASAVTEATGDEDLSRQASRIRAALSSVPASSEDIFADEEGATQPQYEQPPQAAPVTLFPPPSTSEAVRPAAPASPSPPPGAAMAKLSELVRAVAVLGPAPIAPFDIRADVVLISVRGELLTRLSGLSAYGGSFELKSERKRFRGRLTDRSFGEGAEQVMRAIGTGTLIVDAKKRTFVATQIGGESAYFRESAVFAFEGSLSFENGRLPSEMSPDLDLVYLRGNGQVLLCCGGPLRALEVGLTRPATVPLDELVGWYGNLTPRIAVVTFDETGKVLRAGVELSGEGFVLFSAALS